MKSAVILAGGKSIRMGMDKCTVLFHEKPLFYWSYIVLKEVVDEMIISVSKDGDLLFFQNFLSNEINIVMDEKPDLGPISGLSASFKKAEGEFVAVSPCDTPFIKTELYHRLFELAKETDGSVPEVRGYWEPLHGVYRRNPMIKAIDNVLAEGKTRLKETYRYLNLNKLNEAEIRSFDPELVSFFNINSFQDLAKASSIFEKIQDV